MIEDRAFNDFLKSKLEADVGEIPAVVIHETSGVTETSGTTRKSFGIFRPSYLVAASVAVVCCALTVHTMSEREKSCEREAVCAIELLDVYQRALAANGEISSLIGAETFEEKLLAWQDAPYDEIAN